MRREKDQLRREIDEGMDMFNSNVQPRRRVFQRRTEWWECGCPAPNDDARYGGKKRNPPYLTGCVKCNVPRP